MLVLPLILAACGPLTPPEQHYGFISVHAVDSEGAPVPGVRTEVRSPAGRVATGVTRSDGSLVFDFLPRATYQINVIEAPDLFIPRTQPNPIPGIHVSPGDTTRVPVRLMRREQLGLVRVLATRPDETPLGEVRLELRTSTRHVAGGLTDAAGTWEIDLLDPDWYMLNVVGARDHYLPRTAMNPVTGLDVRAGGEVLVPLRLYRRSELGTVRVRAVDQDGSPVGSVQVELRGASRGAGSGTTDARGEWELDLLEPQLHLLNIHAAPPGVRLPVGSPNPVLHIEVRPGEVTLVEIEFVRA
jgi:hypothetical protein